MILIRFLAGGIELNNFEQEEQTRNLIKIIGHPNYDSNTISNDVCLLHLQEPLTFNDWVQPLPLPAQGQETEAGTSCTVTGWGTTSEGGFVLPNKLHKVDVPVVSDEECNVAYADSNPILDSMICAGCPRAARTHARVTAAAPSCAVA